MDDVGFGLWGLVILNTVGTVALVAMLFHPKTRRDWRAMGVFSAFAVALFTEMYGFPLTLYLLSGPLGSRFPELTITHRGGHIWNDLIGWRWDPHLSPFHLASYLLLLTGFVVIALGWRRLFAAVREERLATQGVYAYVRHPQYLGFLLVMVGFLLQWPTIPTLILFPVFVLVYNRLATSEECEVRRRFGKAWDEYAARTPRVLPRELRPQSLPAPRPSGA